VAAVTAAAAIAHPPSLPQAGGATRIAGYAAIFDRVDRGGDVVRRGAFAASLAEARTVPLLWQHDPARVVGTVETLAEDQRGLRLVARVEPRVGALVAARRVTGLSFGYRVRRAAGTNPRELLDVELIEVSLVKAPMQPLAGVIAVGV
jgi:hypothetical protein